MNDLNKRLKKVFEKEAEIEKVRKKLDIKMNKNFQRKVNIAFELYTNFLNLNKEFYKNSEYFRIHIDSGYFLAEELKFATKYDNFIAFNHKSIHRQNQSVSVYLNLKRDDYDSNSAVIDKNQYNELLKEFPIKIRV